MFFVSCNLVLFRNNIAATLATTRSNDAEAGLSGSHKQKRPNQPLKTPNSTEKSQIQDKYTTSWKHPNALSKGNIHIYFIYKKNKAHSIRKLLPPHFRFCWRVTWNCKSNSMKQGRNPLFISEGGEFSWTFIRWRHRAHSTVIQLLRERSQIKFFSQHFRKWELFTFDQDADRTIRTE